MKQRTREKRDADPAGRPPGAQVAPETGEEPAHAWQLPADGWLERSGPPEMLDLQRRLGNRVVLRSIERTAGGTHVMRAVEYNVGVGEDRVIDLEPAEGTLPFTEEGWDGREIARRLSQLNPAAPRTDAVRCVETSFLVALVLRGPDAVNEMIGNYLRRYRRSMRQESTPAEVRASYAISERRLTPIPARIRGQTATYEDLSTLLREMYDVYGSSARRGTSGRAENTMLRREGYTAQAVGMQDVTQAQAAAVASTLEPGEYLSCAVNVTRLGTGQANHAIHIGAYPDTGALYLYDPWPMAGDQLIDLDANLNVIRHFFVNEPGDVDQGGAIMIFEPEEIEAGAGREEEGEPAEAVEGEPAEAAEGEGVEEALEEEHAPEPEEEGEPVPRTFEIRFRYTPPAAAAEEEGG